MDHHNRIAATVARHEMGHFVVATVLGFETGDVTLELIDMEGHSGGAAVTLARPIRTIPEMEDHLERRIQILYAGAIAETLKPNSPDRTVDRDQATEIINDAQHGAGQDKAKAAELLHLVRNLRHPATVLTDHSTAQAELDVINDGLWEKTIDLVETHRDDILGLAGNLAARVKMTNTVYTLPQAELGGLPAVIRLLAIGAASTWDGST